MRDIHPATSTGVSKPPRRLSSWRAPWLMAAVLIVASPMSVATPEKAARFYEDALKRYEKKDFEGTVIQLKNAIQEHQKLLSAHLLLGKVLLKSGEIPAAQAAFEEALKQGVSKSEVALPLGQIYLMLGERQRLLDQLDVTGMPAPMHAEVLTMRGTALSLLGREQLATKAFADARLADPKAPAPLLAEASMALRLGERDKARGLAAKAVELAPSIAGTWVGYAQILQALDDSKGAMQAYLRALALDGRNTDARVGRAGLLINAGRDKEASADLDLMAEDEILDARASYLRGLLGTRANDPAKAKAGYAEAVDLIESLPPGVVSGDESLLMMGALAHIAANNIEKGRGYLEALVSLNRRNTFAKTMLAGQYLDAKDYAKAQPLLEDLQRGAPDDPQLLFMLGSVKMAKRQYQEASELFEKAISKGNSATALRELSFSQFALGKTANAQANLEKAFKANGSDARAGFQLAMLYIGQGKPKEALAVAQTLSSKDPGNLTTLNFLANIQGRTGDKAGARTVFNQVLSKDPDFASAIASLGWLDIEERRFDDARKRLTQALAKRKNDQGLLFQLGALEFRAGRNAEALKHWEKANDGQRSDPNAGLAMIDLYLSQKQAPQALEVAKGLNTVFGSNFVVQLALARCYIAAGDLAGARSTLQAATRFADFDADKQVAIGQLQLAAQNLDGAAYNVQKALQGRADDLNALVMQVDIAVRRGDAAKIDAALKQLTAKHPNATATLLANAGVAMVRKQYTAAQAAYRTAFERNPSTSLALMQTQALAAGGNPEGALSFLEGWSRKNPKDAEVKKALGQLQLQTGKFEAARASFAALLDLVPDDAGTAIVYAYLQQKLKDPGALAAAERAHKLAPEAAEALDVLGWAHSLQGRHEVGLRYLREARLRNPDHGVIRVHLAYALAKTGKKAEAREELSTIDRLSNAPSQQELAAVQAELVR